MLVAAGLDRRRRPRSRTPTRPGSTRTRPWSTSSRRTCFRAPPTTSRTCSTWPSGRVPGPRLPVVGGQPVRLGRFVPRLRRALGQHARQPARRPPPRPRARQARARRLRAVEGGRRRPDPSLAEPLGGRLPRLAPRVLGDGARYLGPDFEIHTGGIDNIFPHHEDEIAQSTPVTGGSPFTTGSTVSTCSRRAGRWPSPPATSSASRSSGTAASTRSPSATSRSPWLRPQAQLFGRVARRVGGRAGLAAGQLIALGPPRPAARGPRPSRCGRASPDGGRRASRTASRATRPILRRPRRAGVPALGPCRDARCAALRREPSSSTTHRRGHRRRPRPAHGPGRDPRGRPSDLPPDERRWRVLDADLVLGLDLNRPGVGGRTGTGVGGDELPDGAAALLEAGTEARPRANGHAWTNCVTLSPRRASRSLTVRTVRPGGAGRYGCPGLAPLAAEHRSRRVSSP